MCKFWYKKKSVLYLFVHLSLCRRQRMPNICTLFCLVIIKQRSFLTSCVFRFMFSFCLLLLWVYFSTAKHLIMKDISPHAPDSTLDARIIKKHHEYLAYFSSFLCACLFVSSEYWSSSSVWPPSCINDTCNRKSQKQKQSFID